MNALYIMHSAGSRMTGREIKTPHSIEPELELSPNGESQVADVARRISAELRHDAAVRIYTGNHQPEKNTAMALCRNLSQYDAQVIERRGLGFHPNYERESIVDLERMLRQETRGETVIVVSNNTYIEPYIGRNFAPAECMKVRRDMSRKGMVPEYVLPGIGD